MLNASYNYSVQNSYSAAYTPIRCPYRPQTYFLIFIYYRAKYYDAVADVLSDQHPDIMDIMVNCAACNSFRSADFRSFGGSKYFELDLGILVYYRYISLIVYFEFLNPIRSTQIRKDLNNILKMR